MVAAEGAFPHDGYGGLRNYGAPEPVTSSPYPPPGKHLLRLANLLFFLSQRLISSNPMSPFTRKKNVTLNVYIANNVFVERFSLLTFSFCLF